MTDRVTSVIGRKGSGVLEGDVGLCEDKGNEKPDFQTLGSCERHEFAVHEETFEPTFLTAGSQLKV